MIPSRRDEIAVEGLLDLFDREVTVDPEKRDPERRAAIKKIIAQARGYYKQKHAANERKKDDALRAKLDAMNTGNRVQRSYPAANPNTATSRDEIQIKPKAGLMQSTASGKVYKVRSRQRPLTTVLNSIPTQTPNDPPTQAKRPSLPMNSAVASAELSTTSTLRSTEAGGTKLAIRKEEKEPLKITTPLVVVQHHIDPGRERSSPASSRTLPAGSFSEQIKSPPILPGIHGSIFPSVPALNPYAPTTRVYAPIEISDSIRQNPQSRPGPCATDTKTSLCQSCNPQSADQERLSGSLRREDFEVKYIRGKRLVNNKVEYLVRWKSTWMAARFVHRESDDEHLFIMANGAKWRIKKTLGRRERDGIRQVKVRWADTHEPARLLSNAREAIQRFEAKQQKIKNDDGEYVRRRRILTIADSKFPAGSVLPQTEEDYAASQRWIASLWPRILPHETLDLYPAIYRIHMELIELNRGASRGVKSYRCLMKLPQIRPLRWNTDFLESGKLFNCGKRRRASLFIQVTGALTAPHCKRCLGERLTPFLGCVKSHPHDQLWLNGACANCGTQDNGNCDYHGLHHGQRAQRKKPSTGHTKTSNGGDGYNLDISNRDNNGIDDSEDDSESDDSEDSDQEEDDHDRPQNSSPWPSSPPLPPVNGRNTQHAECTASSSTGSTWPSSAASGSSSSDRMISSPLSERPGKLRSVTKRNRRRAQETSTQTTLPSTRAGAQSSSSANVHQNSSSLREIFLAKEADIHRIDPPTSSIGDSRCTNYDPRRSRDEFDPEPLEQDILDALAKYDESEPRGNRALGGVGVAEATIARDVGRQGILTEQRANETMPQHPQIDKTDMSSASVSSSGRKRAAPTPLPPARLSRRRIASVGSRSSDPTNILSDLSSSAPAQKLNTATIDDILRAIAARTFLQICTTADEIERDAVHPGCLANHPCRDYRGPAPVPRNPLTLVYHNTLSERRPATLEEVEYILSQANCFWARRFTVIWATWCLEHEDEPRSQTEWLLSRSFHGTLVNAARDCCPKEVIMID